MRMRRKARNMGNYWLLLLAMALLVLAGAGYMAYRFLQPEVYIALVYPGPSAKFEAYLFGMQEAAREINKEGGIGGNCVRIRKFEEKGSKEDTKRIAEEIAKKDNIVAVVGFSNSRRAEVAIKAVCKAGIPILSSAGVNYFDAESAATFFTTNPGVMEEVEYFLAFTKERKNAEAIFVFEEGDSYSHEFFSALQTARRTFLVRQEIIQPYDRPDSLLRRLPKMLRDTGLVLSLGVEKNARFARAIRAAGMENDIYLGRGGMIGGEFFDEGGEGLKNIFELSALLVGMSNEKLEEFGEEHLGDLDSSYLEYAAYAYDMVNLLKKSSRLGESASVGPKEIRRAITAGLKEVEFSGESATYSFDRMNRIHPGLNQQFILQWSGTSPLPYPVQFRLRGGAEPEQLNVIYCFLDCLSLKIHSQEARNYDMEFMLHIYSRYGHGIEDLDFDNASINREYLKRSEYIEPFSANSKSNSSYDLYKKTYRVFGSFEWDNRIENYPIDTPSIVMAIRPKETRNILFFLNKNDPNGNMESNFVEKGWRLISMKSGYREKFLKDYDFISGTEREYKVYRSSLIFRLNRDLWRIFTKFVVPLAFILFIPVAMLFFSNEKNNCENEFKWEKISILSMLAVAVVGLYYIFSTTVNVSYNTNFEWIYIGSLIFLIMIAILVRLQYSSTLFKIKNWTIWRYRATCGLSSFVYVLMFGYAVYLLTRYW